jgi:hypothetical protein
MMHRSDDRRLPVGLLFVAVAGVAVLAIARSVGGGSGQVGAESSPSAAVVSVAPSSSAVSAPPATEMPVPYDSESPGPSAIAVGGNGDCGRISPAACARAIALARKGHEPEVAGASRIVVDDACSRDSMCDRMYPFDSVVVFVTAGGDTTGWYAYEVQGLEYDKPTKVQRWDGEIPTWVVEQLRAPQPSS